MSEPTDLRTQLAALFAKAKAEIAEAEERALALLDRREPDPPADWKTLKEAAFACGCHVETMARWARVHGLGRRIDRTWHVDMNRVSAWRAGQPYERLPQDEMSEDSVSNG